MMEIRSVLWVYRWQEWTVFGVKWAHLAARAVLSFTTHRHSPVLGAHFMLQSVIVGMLLSGFHRVYWHFVNNISFYLAGHFLEWNYCYWGGNIRQLRGSHGRQHARSEFATALFNDDAPFRKSDRSWARPVPDWTLAEVASSHKASTAAKGQSACSQGTPGPSANMSYRPD